MFDHLVVAADFSPSWEFLEKQLPALRGWGCSQMTLVHVLASPYPQAPAYYENRLAVAVGALRSAGIHAASTIVAGEPAVSLIQAAQQAGAGGLLVGSHGHSVLRSFFIGSTALNLARMTQLPMLLVPTLAQLPISDRLRKVVLGSDCSGAAKSAERFFLELVDGGAEGIAVCAIERGEAGDRGREEHCASVHVERLGGDCRGSLATRIERGEAAGVIIKVARDSQADLIVVGKRGHNRMRDLLLGSTAEAVCRRAEVPVALIPG